MADSMDLVQQRVEEQLQRHIHTARNRAPGIPCALHRVRCTDPSSAPPCPSGRAVLRNMSGNR